MSVRIVPLERGVHGDWDRFVADRPDATFFHQSAMPGLICRVFGHRDRSIAAVQDGAVVGVLPLVELRTRLFGHTLMSLPFCVYAGPLAADAHTARSLIGHAAELRQSTGAAALELRGLTPPPADWFGEDGWSERPGLYATFRRRIDSDDAANLKAIPRKQRAVVRKGIERGLDVTVAREAGTAWRIYAESVRNLGSPVFPRRWFEGLLAAFPDGADATVVADAGEPIASVLNFHWRDAVRPYYGGGTPAARDCQAYDTMYWNVMCRAAARGAKIFDFGRSKEGTGAYAFKKNWGFFPTPLTYRFLMRPGQPIPENNPLNPKYRLMIATWKKLPLPVANLLGPHLVRGVG